MFTCLEKLESNETSTIKFNRNIIDDDNVKLINRQQQHHRQHHHLRHQHRHHRRHHRQHHHRRHVSDQGQHLVLETNGAGLRAVDHRPARQLCRIHFLRCQRGPESDLARECRIRLDRDQPFRVRQGAEEVLGARAIVEAHREAI